MAKDTFADADYSANKTPVFGNWFSSRETAASNTANEKTTVNAFSSAKNLFKVPPERSWLGADWLVKSTATEQRNCSKNLAKNLESKQQHNAQLRGE
ncbi:hypothetical protein ACOIXW_004644 [Vibrio parahaemolyticus]|nr:hypothetical protein [Vibrio parahaemolyticus]